MNFSFKKILLWVLVALAVVAVVVIIGQRKQSSSLEEAAITAVDESMVRAQADKANQLAAERRWIEARSLYQEIVEQYSDSVYGQEAQAKLDDIGLAAYFQSLNEENSLTYTVRPGDNLTVIASRYGVTSGTIMAANHLKSDHIRPGMDLKIMRDSWSMLVDKSRNILFLKAGEEVVRSYPVASGKDNSTPAGDFVIINRLTDPTWYYEGQVEPAGSPDNPLGNRWMGFDIKGYGLHGTTDPDKIGQYATLGCLRMHNKDIEELFELIPVGSLISIIE